MVILFFELLVLKKLEIPLDSNCQPLSCESCALPFAAAFILASVRFELTTFGHRGFYCNHYTKVPHNPRFGRIPLQWGYPDPSTSTPVVGGTPTSSLLLMVMGVPNNPKRDVLTNSGSTLTPVPRPQWWGCSHVKFFKFQSLIFLKR